MKMGSFFLLCIIVMSINPAPETTVPSSPPADVLYAHEEWAAALAAYEKEPNPSAGVLMRMGECAARQKKYPIALRYLYQALPCLYGVAYYSLSLSLVALQREAGLVIAPLGPQWYVATSAAAVPPLVWQLFALLLLMMWLLYLRSWWAQRRYILLGLLLFFIGASASVAWWSIAYRGRIAAVAAEALVLRAGPDKRYSEVGSVPAGTPLPCTSQMQLPGGSVYYKVSSAGQVGWVPIEGLLKVAC